MMGDTERRIIHDMTEVYDRTPRWRWIKRRKHRATLRALAYAAAARRFH